MRCINIPDIDLSSVKKRSNLPDECKNLILLGDFLNSIFSYNGYIPKSMYLSKAESFKSTTEFFDVLEKSNMLKSYCSLHKIPFKKLSLVLYRSKNLEKLVDEKNEQFVNEQLISQQDYLDNILYECDPKISLDEDQRRVVLTDEDYCLVIAGAGAGKTTTVAAKVKYLVEKRNIDPKKILVISFTNKAVNELKQRIISQLHIVCPIATFHSTGNAILHKQNSENLNIADSSKLYTVILNYMKSSALKNESLANNIILFFASYLNPPSDETDLKSFFADIAKCKFTTLRSELNSFERSIIDNRTKKSVTILEEKLRSSQEVEIANFLYLNGIDYEYEPLYPYNIPYARKPYTPDFVIRQGDNTAYIEHFGITEDGKSSRFSEKELSLYKKAINDKVLLHRQHDTKLIYTFSSYKDGLSLTEHLRQKLESSGFTLSPRPSSEIIEKLVSEEENNIIKSFVVLIQRFIANFKVNNYSEDDFSRMYHSTSNVRTKLFLDICRDCYLEYERYLKENNAVDFEDMINESARLLREVKEMKQKLDFDYIIVDEYQDISRQRFDLVSALHAVTDAKIIAVGDDWQSIYAFSGSDITLFTKFREKMGYAKLLKIVRTYRNSQEVIDIAGNFIQKNEEQIKKDLISPKHINDPVIIYTFDNTYKKRDETIRGGSLFAMASAVETAIGQICEFNKAENKPYDSSILLIGRFGFDGINLQRSGLFEYVNRGNKLKSKKYPKLNITFMTAHSSKGLGYDNVIVVNGSNSTYGFPAKISDDPVLSLVTRTDNSIEYAEERRLFYVALTRTKNRVFFIAPENNPSEFLLELKRDYKNVSLRGKWSETPVSLDTMAKRCPMCGYPMQFRYKPSIGLPLYICTNDSEVCGFITTDYKAGKLGIVKCDSCRDGYMIPVRSGDHFFLGCTNYKKDGSGCSNTMTKATYYSFMNIKDDEPLQETVQIQKTT